MRDMIPPGERSIRNIPLSKKQEAKEREDFPQTPAPRRRPGRSRRFWILLLVVVVVCLAISFFASTLFAGASVTIHPHAVTVTAPSTMSAGLNAPVGQLSFQTISVTRSATTTARASGTQQVSKAASGIVMLYNTYSTAQQRLIVGTRLQAPDGKIYKIRDAVVVPGGTKAADGSLTPGTVLATIFAEAGGADYNRTAQTTFTIPGFKGDPRYTKFYAQSQGTISGGFVGTQATVAAADLTAAKNTLSQQLASDLTAAATAAIPDGYVALPGTLKITYSDVAQVPSGDKSANVSESATASGAIVRLVDLASQIARTTVSGYKGEAVSFADPSKLSVMATSTKDAGTITLALTGSPTLVWQFDPNAVRDALVGKSKSQFESVLQSFAPAIDCTSSTPCDATIRPFWSSTFPSDSSKIDVTTK